MYVVATDSWSSTDFHLMSYQMFLIASAVEVFSFNTGISV